uniref:Sulfate ABC transporter permease subunit CysW n=1 Tax=Oscillatoriales cyanobacterium SpSt-402 TaxID=2282168 RepID=A0A832H1E7_9CYAN
MTSDTQSREVSRRTEKFSRKAQGRSQSKSIPWAKYGLIMVGLSFLAFVVLIPLGNIFYQAFLEGINAYWQGIWTPEGIHAISLTLITVAVTVPLNTLFGILTAWVLARQRFPGKPLLTGILDLPLTISPVIVGLMFILLFSTTEGLFKEIVLALNVNIVFALPGIILSATFITLPYVAREVLPALQTLGLEQEEAAHTLGASPWQTFWRVVLPNIRWAVLYGVILCTARAVGEFGAVSVVSGRVIGATNTLTLHVEQLYMSYLTVAAFACATLLTLVAVITLIAQELLRGRSK